MNADWRTDSALEARLAQITLAVFDVDGVLTDGRLFLGADGEVMKVFHVHDGLGLKRLMARGIEVAIITARSSSVLARRMDELGIRHVFQGEQDKGRCLQGLLETLRIDASHCAYMGDDLPDLAAMAVAGVRVAPANARPELRDIADLTTVLAGGEGAVREFCERVLAARDAVLDSAPGTAHA